MRSVNTWITSTWALTRLAAFFKEPPKSFETSWLSMARTWLAKLGAFIAQGAFRALKDKMDPRNLNGGIFLGLNGIVVKSHGGTDAIGFASAIDVGYDMARSGVLGGISDDISRFEQALHRRHTDAFSAAVSKSDRGRHNEVTHRQEMMPKHAAQ